MKRMSYEQFLNEIKTPKDLLHYMRNNIDYGIVDKNKKKIKNPTERDFYKNLVILTPEEVYEYQIGICWEQCEFQRVVFDRLGIENKVIFVGLWYNKKHYNTHTFSIFKDKKLWRWFESSWGNHRGISEKDTEESLIRTVIKQFIEDNDDGFDYIVLGEIIDPPFGQGYNDYLKVAHSSITTYATIEDLP